MNGEARTACRAVAGFGAGLLATLCLSLPVLASPGQAPDEKTQAAKVAKKMERAKTAAHQAEEEREALEDFQKAVAEYASLHARELARIRPRETVAAQKTLAQAIAAKRAKARPGDIFGPDIQPLFRRLIAEQLVGPDALDARKALREDEPAGEEPPVPVDLRVNAEYPVGASRSTVPPSLLVALPPLPALLHYRFVGRDLVLIDSVAGILVDILPDAAPAVAVR